MDLEALDDRDLLDDTPIGDLVVRRFGDVNGVGIVHRGDPDGDKHLPRLVHLLEARKPGHQVLDAIYGKRFWEDAAVVELHQRAADAAQERGERHSALVSRDMRRGLERWLATKDDARDLLIAHGRR